MKMTSSIETHGGLGLRRAGVVLLALLVLGAPGGGLHASEGTTSGDKGAATQDRGARGGGGIKLPGGIQLNGKFDLNYERRGYTDDASEGDSAFANYHRFLFVTRRSVDDPLYFSGEVLDLTFYYVGGRFRVPDSQWTLSAEVGKIMVPFGSDPLFHHAYGGLSGFDQQILPTVWAQFGLSGKARYGFTEGNVKIEAFAVQGYALSKEDASLNLAADLSSTGDIEIALGMRAGFSYGPVTVYYSLLYNDVRFDRHLVMQALDVTARGPRGVPVIEDLTLSIGVLRADLFGGDPAATYEFADYLELRYAPTAFLFFWYRGGMRTRNNRKGLFYDDRDVGPGDESAHTLGVGARFYGATLRLSHTWRLEKDIELDNDFLRLSLTYDF